MVLPEACFDVKVEHGGPYRLNTLAAPHCRTVHRLKSFLPSTVTLFNSLPSSAVSCSSKSSFKHAIDLHFVEDKFSFGLL